MLTPQVTTWGTALIKAEQAILGGKAAAVTKAVDSLTAMVGEIGTKADEVSSGFLNRGNGDTLRGAASLLGDAAGAAKTDAHKAVWHLRDAGERLRAAAAALDFEHVGGAAGL